METFLFIFFGLVICIIIYIIMDNLNSYIEKKSAEPNDVLGGCLGESIKVIWILIILFGIVLLIITGHYLDVIEPGRGIKDAISW
jgi:phage shock protein PspC (stress-responsive transcriptional regulator)